MKKESKNELDKMLLMMERMDNHYTTEQVEILNESIEEKLDARNRDDVDTSEFFDMIAQMKGGSKATIGYVSAADLNIPQVKRKNPETNRMKNYDDWDTFNNQLGTEDVAGVLKFGCYNLNWRSPENMRKHYNVNYVDAVNNIRDKYGVKHMSRRKPYTQTMEYGNGISMYNGDNEELRGHSYSPQDLGNAKKDVKYYLVNSNGDIIREATIEELKPYFKTASVDGIRAFKEMQKSDEEIQAYAKEVASLNFRYTQFEHTSVIFVITSINGEKKRFFNKNVRNNINGLNINPQEVINLAKEKYRIADENIKDNEIGEFDDEFKDYVDTEEA